MANSRARCVGCKAYRLQSELTKVGLSRICTDSPECRKTVLNKGAKSTVKQKAAAKAIKRQQKPGLSLELRKEIHARDKSCRFCGQIAMRMECHHINYRSGPNGKDANWNLILLCQEHHMLAHSDKKRWQPILRAYVWFYYVEGKRGWAISKVEGAVKARCP